MLKFFRRISKSIKTGNRVGKYLFYAGGEIVLVVIGILLALSINNWNEERKMRVKEEYFLSKQSSNLKDDIKQFYQVIEYEKDVAHHLDSILIIIRNPTRFEIADLRNHERSFFAFKRFYTNKTAFDNLVSSGQIDIIENQSLVEKLFTYYRDVNEQESSGDAALATYSRNNVGPFFMQFDFQNSSNDHGKSKLRKEKSLIEYHLEPQADNLIVFKLSLINSQISSYNELIKKAEIIIKILESD